MVELLVALALSSILLVGLFQIFTSNRQAFDLQGGVARAQESGRISMEFMARTMRTAGFLGCASGDTSSPLTNAVNVDLTLGSPSPSPYTVAFVSEFTLFDGTNGVTGFENVTGANARLNNLGIAVGTGNRQLISGTDAIIVHGVEPCPGTSGRVTASSTTTVTIEDATACGLAQNDVVVVSSCQKAEAFGITNNLTATNQLQRSLANNTAADFATGSFSDEGSYVFRPTITAFYVGNSVTGTGANQVRDVGLFMTRVQRNGTATGFETLEIAAGVESLQFLFGEDTDATEDFTVDRYIAADVVSDFERVLAVRSRLLTRTDDRIATGNQTYIFNGAPVTATDQRLRVPYETTNTIRNRLK